jgi:hypothetical protein
VSQHWVSDGDGSDSFEWDSDGNGEEAGSFNTAGASSSAMASTNTDAPGPSRRVSQVTDPYMQQCVNSASCSSVHVTQGFSNHLR